METSSSQLTEIKLPSISSGAHNISSAGLTGAVAPIPIGSEIKPFPSFDFMFENSQPSSNASRA